MFLAIMCQQAIDEYIAAFPPDVPEILQKVRATIREAAPDAQEKIDYGIPTFTLHGNLVHFAGFKNHVSFFPDPSGIEHFIKEAGEMCKNMVFIQAIFAVGGLIGVLGGLIWALMFFMEATNPEFDLRNVLLDRSVFSVLLILSVAFQSLGFFSLANLSSKFSIPRISAAACSLGAITQAAALLLVSFFGLGVAWLLGILGEMLITVTLAAFAVSAYPTSLHPMLKIVPFLMVPFYFVGWAFDPAVFSITGIDLVNWCAAMYGLLWLPLGFTIWKLRRDQVRDVSASFGSS